MKTCPKCKSTKSFDEFHKNQCYCKECRSELDKKYRERRAEYSRTHDLKSYTDKNYLKLKTEQPEKYLWKLAKKRAIQSGIEFNIEIKDIKIPNECPIFKVPLTAIGTYVKTSPSLDRIDPTKGYVKGNVSVISYRANVIKNDGNEEEHLLIYQYLMNVRKDNEIQCAQLLT